MLTFLKPVFNFSHTIVSLKHLFLNSYLMATVIHLLITPNTAPILSFCDSESLPDDFKFSHGNVYARNHSPYLPFALGRRKDRCIKYKRCLVVSAVLVLAEPEGGHCINLKYKWVLDGVKIAVSNTNDVTVLLSDMSVVTVQSFLLLFKFAVTCQTKVVVQAIIASSYFNLKLNIRLLLVFDTATSPDIPSRPRLYLIQRASQDIASQPCPSPLVTQFIKISELSFIAHRHRQRPAACIWCSNGPWRHFFMI